jgi:signal transduction histidine kinase
MPKGGTVTVRVSAQQRNEQTVARIEVADEGVGISPATEKQIFQPFFTTKATGTGLGLAVVKRIIDAHHGEISVTSALGGGTTFTVMLPSN